MASGTWIVGRYVACTLRVPSAFLQPRWRATGGSFVGEDRIGQMRKRSSRALQTAHGMCLLPWRSNLLR